MAEIRAKIQAFDKEVNEAVAFTSDFRKRVEAFVEYELTERLKKKKISCSKSSVANLC